jgi:hypothetical protein
MTVPAPAESGSSSGHVSPLRYVSFSADSSKVLFNSLHGETTVVGLKERRILRTFTCEQLDSYVMGPFLGFAPDGRPIRAGSPTLIYLDLERGEVSWKKFPQGCAVNFLSPDGSMVAGRIYKNGTNACIQVSDGEGKELRSIPARDDVVSIGYSPAKGQVAIACTGDHLDLYDLATGMKIQDFSAPAIMARDARFSADGNFISLHRQRVVGRHGQQRFENWADHWNLRTATMEKRAVQERRPGVCGHRLQAGPGEQLLRSPARRVLRVRSAEPLFLLRPGRSRIPIRRHSLRHHLPDRRQRCR